MSEAGKAPNYQCKKTPDGKDCGGIEWDIHLYNATMLVMRCRKCGQHMRTNKAPYPLQMRSMFFEKKDQVVQVIDDEGVKAMLDEKDEEIRRLKEKLGE